MKWIGLTGGLATGKSTVSQILRTRGFAVIDADALVRKLTADHSPVLQDLRRGFGDGIFSSEFSLDRKKLAQVVFQNPDQLKKLEEILHPKVRQQMLVEKEKFRDEGRASAFYDVPLLFEKNLEKDFDAVVLVYCSPSEQVRRMQLRDGWSDSEIQARMNAQIPIDAKKPRAQFVIDNSGTVAELENKIDEMLKALRLNR